MPVKTFGFIFAAAALAMSMKLLNGQLTLSCVTPSDPEAPNAELTLPGSPREAAELRNAPHPAMRVKSHTLEINWERGKRLFRDRPPFDVDLDGVRWTYCGYNPQLRMHLIGQQNVDVFTGALLDDLTGFVLPAGETVAFSPSKRYYLAYEQPDGQDGATITLYSQTGIRLWKGFDGLLSGDGKSVAAEFETVQWSGDDDRLIAEYTASGTRHRLILTRTSKGKWHWQPAGSR